MIADFYPIVLDAVALHEFVMTRTGAAPAALRDEGALDGALNRPRMAAHYEDADMATQTVLLIGGIALAHPFVDGNNCTALIVGDTFLERNGWVFTGDYLALAKQIEALVNRAGSLEQATAAFVAWLCPQLRPRP